MGRTSIESAVTSTEQASLFPRVLCAVDGKDGGYAAVRQAASLTGGGGKLTLLLVTSFRDQPGRLAPAINATDAEKIVERAESIATEAGVTARIEVDPAFPPADVVLEWTLGYDLLAIGAPASPWIESMFVAGVADSAQRALLVPVLTARGAHWDGLWDHVLIASDGLADSAMPLAYGARVAAAHGARVTLLHAVGHRGAGEGPLLAQISQLHEHGVADPDLIVRHGHAHQVIVDVAEGMGASLVVIGSRRRSGPRALGSVSRRVIHEAGCSVLTVPPEAAGPGALS